MTDRDDYFELIRQLARGDYDGYRARCAVLDEKGWDDLGLVVGATFFQAVEQRFSPRYTQADVIRLVADTRADMAGTGFDMDPAHAETLINAVLTGDTDQADTIDANTVVEAEMMLLRQMLGDLPDTEVGALFRQADTLAEQWSRSD